MWKRGDRNRGPWEPLENRVRLESWMCRVGSASSTHPGGLLVRRWPFYSGQPWTLPQDAPYILGAVGHFKGAASSLQDIGWSGRHLDRLRSATGEPLGTDHPKCTPASLSAPLPGAWEQLTRLKICAGEYHTTCPSMNAPVRMPFMSKNGTQDIR